VIAPTTGAVGEDGCGLMTTSADDPDVHPSELVMVKLYVPATRPETVVLVPVPFDIIAPGLRINVHVPAGGNPLSTTLPVPTVHVKLVIVPTTGAVGKAFTVKVNVATAAAQGDPCGLLVVTVIITVLPPSAIAGV
jgi:hypothetical protein